MQNVMATIAAPGSGEIVDVLGAKIQLKCAGDPRRMFLADHAVPPGYAVPMHIHDEEDEAFYVLEGRVTFSLVEGETVAGPGAFVHLPRGVAHGFANLEQTAARMLVIGSPGGRLENLFRDLDAAAAEPLTPERVARVCADNGVRMLAPQS
jgi:mannose-6-phosphate isomerase-like protein (cupin superfamily)